MERRICQIYQDLCLVFFARKLLQPLCPGHSILVAQREKFGPPQYEPWNSANSRLVAVLLFGIWTRPLENHQPNKGATQTPATPCRAIKG